MSDWWLPIIGPAGPILGALLGATITALVALRNRERKKITIVVFPSEDLTLPLKQHHHLIVFRIGSREMLNLNRGRVRVINSGNATIKDLQISVTSLGDRLPAFCEVSARKSEVSNAVTVTQRGLGAAAYFEVSIPFLNRREVFDLYVFFEGATEDLVVNCRQEGLTVVVRHPINLEANTFAAAIARGAIKGLISH